MKKYVILTLVLSAALLICGFVAVSVPSAQAITTTLPDSGVVRDNLLPNNDFSNLGSNNVPVGYSLASTGNTFSFSSSTGFRIVRSSSSANILFYVFSPALNLDSFTLSFCARVNSGSFRVNFFTGSSTSLGPLATSSSYTVYSQTFTGSSFTRMYFSCPIANSDVDILWIKIESGSSFTGYVPSNYLNYGFDQGYVNGLLDYSFHSDNLVFNGVETQNYLPIGWSDLYGLSSITPLLTAQFSLTSRFYEQQGYSIESQGTIPIVDTNNNTIGFVIWISPYTLLASNFRESSSYFEVALLEHECYLRFADPNFPSGWNPVTYPNAKSVTLFAEYGFTEYVQQLQESSYNLGVAKGKIAGYSDGFTEGEASGYNTGYSAGVELARNGTWFALFSAIINIPVSSLMSLLNYDFFGINMWDLARFLLTFILFFAVLHFFTKGKLRA